MIHVKLQPYPPIDATTLRVLVEGALASIGANGVDDAHTTITVPRLWRAPRGFPRCELLSVNTRGEKNMRVAAWPLLRMLADQKLIDISVEE